LNNISENNILGILLINKIKISIENTHFINNTSEILYINKIKSRIDHIHFVKILIDVKYFVCILIYKFIYLMNEIYNKWSVYILLR